MASDEQTKSLDPAAVWVNRLFVVRTNAGTRIAFAEQIDGELRYRSAVMMPDADAMALRDVLVQLFPPPDKQN